MRSSRALQPARRMLQLIAARQLLGPAPHTRERGSAPCSTTPSQKRRPTSYWRIFISSPSRRSSTRQGSPRDSRLRVIAARRRGSEGSTSAPIASIVCSACPSISDIAACIRSTSAQRSSPSVSRKSSPLRARSANSRSSEGSGSLIRSRQPVPPPLVSGLAPSETCSPSISSCSMPPMCPRSHGAPVNCTACVISWIATHSTSSSRSTDRLRAAIARFGASSNRRGVVVSSSSAKSYWPSTRWESTPVSAPTCAPSRKPEAERSGPASGPAPSPSRSLRLPSSGRIVLRLAAIHAERSTASIGGSSLGVCSPLYSLTRRAKSYARGSTEEARTPPCGGEPARRSPIRCAARQSIASTNRA